MNGKTRLEHAGPGPVVAAVTLWLAASGLGGSGCSEHRINLAEFLIAQRQAAAAQPEPLSPEAVRNLDEQLGPYKVGPGDVLTVFLTVGDDGLHPPLQVRINRDGQIDLPIVGAVSVGGKDLEEVEELIRGAYTPAVYRDAVCHVETASVETTNVLVIGAVTLPGIVHLRRTERNLFFAIAGAGGASQLTSGKATLRRVRRPAEVVTLDLHKPVELNAALMLEPLETGDIVYVHAAQPNTVFVGGLVNRPAPQDYPPGTDISVLQALAAAGGLRTDVSPREATLIRRTDNGRDLHVKLDLDRLARGWDPNITLAAGDILWVPETLETKIQEFINRNIFLRGGVVVTYNVTGIEFLNRTGLQSAGLGGRTLQDTFDPFGSLTRNIALQTIGTQVGP
jgi:protein involved in polysaccharide export with SLBB domain